MEKRKTHKKWLIFMAAILIILIIGVCAGPDIALYFQGTENSGTLSDTADADTADTTADKETTDMSADKETTDTFADEETAGKHSESEKEATPKEIYQYALEYLKYNLEYAKEPDAITYSEYSAGSVSESAKTVELGSDSNVYCCYVKNGETIPHKVCTVKITMTYAGQDFPVKIFAYISKGGPTPHHHEVFDSESEMTVSKVFRGEGGETAPYSMEQKYAKLKTNDKDDIEAACADVLYGEWLDSSDNAISVSEYEIDGKGYGILESEPDMYYGGTVLLACKFFYLDTPDEQHELSLIEYRSTGVRYLTIDGAEYANTDAETIARYEQEEEEKFQEEMERSAQAAQAAQVCSQDSVCQQAKSDAVQEVRDRAAAQYGVLAEVIPTNEALATYKADNVMYSYDPTSACHIVAFTLSEYSVKMSLRCTYSVSAQYRDNGNGTISKISLIVQ